MLFAAPWFACAITAFRRYGDMFAERSFDHEFKKT